MSEAEKTGTADKMPEAISHDVVCYVGAGVPGSTCPTYLRINKNQNKMMKDIDLRTPAQRANDERQKRICSLFLEMYSQHPEVAVNRLLQKIADDNGLTLMGVKGILIKRGIYVPNGRKPEIVVSGGD